MDTASTPIRSGPITTEATPRAPAAVTIRAARVGGRTVIEQLRGVEPWRPRLISRPGRVATVVLVSTRESLIGGDDVRLSVTVAAGAALELVELGATVSHHARAGAQATVEIALTVEAGGALVWLGAPLIAAAGCHARRVTHVQVASGGRLLLGEPVALGRAGEIPGALIARTRIRYADAPLLDETIDTSDPETLGSAVVAGRHRLLRSLVLSGCADADPPDGALRLHGPGMAWRSFEDEEPAAAMIAARWRGLVLGGEVDAGVRELAQRQRVTSNGELA